MEKTLLAINELKKQKLIKDFAVGGGIAVLYYIEPLLTYDLDIFFIPISERIDVLAPIYDHFKNKKYKIQQEHVIIEGVPVQFIPVYNELIEEAVTNSVKAKYGRINTQILGLEYLIAIMFQTYRPKDRERIIKVFDEAEIDLGLLKKILKKYGLDNKFAEFRHKYYEK